MTISIRHLKTNNIPDFTQEQLDLAIAKGQYPVGTTLADIVLPSNWNDNHDTAELEAALDAKQPTLPDFTSGQILFGDGDNVPSTDSNFTWDNTNKRLGIGTSTPKEKMEIRGRLTFSDLPTTLPTLPTNSTFQVIASSSNQWLNAIGSTVNGGTGQNYTDIYGLGTGGGYFGGIRMFVSNNSSTLIQALTVGKTGNTSIGTSSDLGRVGIVGAGATSATNSLAVHNSTGSSNSLIIRDDNYVGFGRSTPYNANAGFEVSRTGSNAVFSFINPTGNSGSPFSLLIAVGDGSQVSTGAVIFRTPNNSITIAGNRTTFGVPTITVAQSTQTWKMYGGYGAATLGDSMYLGSNTGNAGNYTATSGTQNTLTLGIGLNSAYETWQPASGNATYNHFRILTSINTSGSYNGTVRSLYIAPILTSLTGTSYRGIELANSAGYSIYQSNSGASNYFAGLIVSDSIIRQKGYTVATLPAGTQGDTCFVTDALAPTYLGVLVGGGAVVCEAFYDGTNWVAK